jgi:hypothetical protein
MCLLWAFLPSPAWALERGHHDASAFVGAEVPLATPSDPRRAPLPFGILGYRWRWTGFFKPNVASEISVNTDTVQAQVDAWDVGIPGSSVSTWARAEGLLAGVNTQWMQDGVNRWERGFTASYAQVGFRASQTAARVFTVETELAFRGWLFTPLPLLSAPGATPTPLLVAEPRVRLKFDGRRPDAHGLGLFTGVAGWLETGVDARLGTRPFGEGTRNRLPWNALPRRVQGRGFLGAHTGRWWLQARAEAALGVDEDDLSRTRVGGLNPYTVNMPGAAWGEFLCERFIATHVEAGLTTLPWLYTGLSVHAAAINDPHRTGELSSVGILRGVALETRVALSRFGLLHLRGGGSTDVLRPGRRAALGGFAWLEVWLPR